MSYTTHITGDIKDLYYRAVHRFGVPRNMLYKTGENNSIWTVVRTERGHDFVFDAADDNRIFAEFAQTHKEQP